MANDEIVFGWAAPKLKEQHPVLDEKDAEHFDRDNEAIIRCHLRGLIPDSQRDAAFKRLTKKIVSSIRRAVRQRKPEPTQP